MHEGYKMTELGELPEEWEVKKLSNLLLIIRNGTTETQVQKKTDYPVTRIETISDWSIDYIKVGFIESEKIAKAFKLLKYDILLSHINSIKHIGKVALYLEEKPLYHGMNLMLLRPNLDNNLDPVFLFKYLTTEYCKKYFESKAKPAINQASLSQKEITDVLVILPPLPEQHRIAEILSTVDETIERTEALIEKYRNIKKGLMADLLASGIDEEGRIRSEETHRFKDSPHGSIPKGWDVTTLNKAIGEEKDQIVAGPFGSNLKVEDYKDEGIPIIRLQNIDFGKFINKDIKYISLKKADELSYHSFIKGDLILAKLGDPIGKTCIIPDFMENGIVVADVVRIRIDNKFAEKGFILQVLNSHYVSYQLNRDIIGTTRPRVNLGQVRNLIVPLISLQEQHRIAEILEGADYRIEKEEAYRNKLLQIKKGLMQDLLTGRVRVKVPQEAKA